MAISHLLDTSVYCQPLKPRPLPGVERRWRALGDDTVATSIICEAELLYGLELKQSARLASLYEQLLKDRIVVYPVDNIVVKEFATLKATCKNKGIGLPDFDILIASTAKAHGLVLATLNVRHFQRFEALALEDWSS